MAEKTKQQEAYDLIAEVQAKDIDDLKDFARGLVDLLEKAIKELRRLKGR